MELNPPGQYADDRNLHARQRLWPGQVPSFDIAAWVLDLAGLMPGGTCVAVTTGPQYLRSLRDPIERAVRRRTPDWRMGAPTGSAFTPQNAGAQLGVVFPEVTCARPSTAGPVIIEDAAVAADYVGSLADHYQPQVARPWRDIAEVVRGQVQAVIDTEGGVPHRR